MRSARVLRENKFRQTYNNRKIGLVFLATLSGVMLFTNVDAANFLFFWKASTDPSVTAYGIYQRTGDSAYELLAEVDAADLDDPDHPDYLVTGLQSGAVYHFAAAAVKASGEESALSNQTCVTDNGQVVECQDKDRNGTVVFINCFINALNR